MPPLQHNKDENINKTEEESSPNETAIQKFYHGKSIFMTGGSGFLGKIIMEKLLRSCNIDTIYVLIRHKKGKDMHSRLDEIFDDILYSRLRKMTPKFRHKICPIAGDCSLPGLGINHNDRQLLIDKVNIVYHVAATVRFDEKLSIAIGINVNGTKEIMDLSREMLHLNAFIHVSTAYANCFRSNIDEIFYKYKMTAENIMKLYKSLDAKTLDAICSELTKEWPNTYTFTKAIAEDLVRTHSKGLPCAVVRPAVVLPTAIEPVPGWIDNMYGPTGMIVGVGAGLIHVCHVHKNNNAELVPVDMCVNSILASAWEISENYYDQPPIYNFVTTKNNPFLWRDYIDYAWKYGSKIPILKSIWYPAFTITDSQLMLSLLWFLYHEVPAFFIDCCLFLVGKKPRMQNVYKKIKKYSDVIFFFTHTKFNFTNHNVQKLWNKLSKADQDLFFFDMEQLKWDEYVESSVTGIRTYLMKDPPSTIPAALKRHKRFKILHYTVIYVIYFLGLLILYALLTRFYRFFF